MKILMTSLLVLTSLIPVTSTAADATAGKQKAGICFGCHGPEGNSAIATNPTLAGQKADYLVNQLHAFKEGKRANPIMGGMAKNLSDDDMTNLAAYFAEQKGKSANGDAALAKEGAAKASQCFGCHAPNAQGRGMFPKLAGQQPAYLAQQLRNFKSGERKSGPMQAIAATLSDADIAQITAYLSTLQ